jgi:hypothetical protein
MTDQAIEQEIQAKGLTAPRVTPAQIDAMVASLTYKTHVFEGTTNTVAMAFLPNGFSVGIGQSASVSLENFNAEIGAKVAIANAEVAARNKLWELEGYVLKQRLSA